MRFGLVWIGSFHVAQSTSLAVVAILACLHAPVMVRAAEDAAIEPAEEWADVFSGSEAKFHYTVRTPKALDGRLNWSLSVKRRTVAHGQLPLAAEAGHVAEVTVALTVPEVKEGVILETQLSVAAYSAGDQRPIAQHVKSIWIFPRDPFADRSQWLKGLKITLFDPEGKTADVLEKARVPFALTKNTAALDDLNEGLLVIGEGTVWRDHRSLGETMVKAAARGVPVLCLAPGEGALVLPGSEGAELPQPASLTLRREDVIKELDQRLDAAWPPQGLSSVSRLAIKSDRDQVVAEAGAWPPSTAIRARQDVRGVGDVKLPSPAGRTRQDGRGAGGEGSLQPPHAWPWLEVRYPAPKGRLLVCGFGIIRHWEATPAARYLLSELLVRLTAERQSTLLPLDERKN